MHTLSEEECAICKMFWVRYISRDSIEDEGNTIDFWSGEPRRVDYGGGVAYFSSDDADRIAAVLADSYNTSVAPGQCLKVDVYDEHRAYEVVPE